MCVCVCRGDARAERASKAECNGGMGHRKLRRNGRRGRRRQPCLLLLAPIKKVGDIDMCSRVPLPLSLSLCLEVFPQRSCILVQRQVTLTTSTSLLKERERWRNSTRETPRLLSRLETCPSRLAQRAAGGARGELFTMRSVRFSLLPSRGCHFFFLSHAYAFFIYFPPRVSRTHIKRLKTGFFQSFLLYAYTWRASTDQTTAHRIVKKGG